MYDFESEAKFKTKTKGKNKNALLLCLLWEHAKCLCKPFFSLYFSSGFCCCFIFVLVNVLLNFFSVCAFMHVFVYSYTLSQKEYYSDWNVRACFIFILDFFCFSLLSTGCLVFAMCIDILHPIQICTLPYILCWVSILKLNCEYRNFWLGSITFVLLFFFCRESQKNCFDTVDVIFRTFFFCLLWNSVRDQNTVDESIVACNHPVIRKWKRTTLFFSLTFSERSICRWLINKPFLLIIAIIAADVNTFRVYNYILIV